MLAEDHGTGYYTDTSDLVLGWAIVALIAVLIVVAVVLLWRRRAARQRRP